MNRWTRIARNKYFRIAVIALVLFVVVWVLKGIGYAAFVLLIAVVVLIYVTFDPRIKRHW